MRIRKLLNISASVLLAIVLLSLTWSILESSAQANEIKVSPASVSDSNVALPAASGVQTDVVRITIIHLNDVYEISPVRGGAMGGLARIATLKQQLLAQNPNTFITFSGDMYSPAALSTAIYYSDMGGDNEPFDGIQVVKVMNTIGLDYMTFGDHEFNTLYGEPFSVATNHFFRNLNQSEFSIVSSNVFSTNGQSFSTPNTTVKVNDTFTVSNESGASATIGIFGVTENIRGDMVGISQTNIISASEIQVASLTNEGADVIIALTHQRLEHDQSMSQQFSDTIDLILGADDHDPKRSDLTSTPPIYKSSSSLENVYVVDLYYDTATNSVVGITPTLMAITSTITENAQTKAVADEWLQRGFQAFAREGISPTEVIVQTPVDLDGFAGTIRYTSTTLTRLIGDGFTNAAISNITATTPYSGHLAFYASGNLRLDDNLPAESNVIWYDIMRTFPTTDSLSTVEISGNVLTALLGSPTANEGTGSYILQSSNVTYSGGWLIDGKPIDSNGTYWISTTKEIADALIQFFGATLVKEHTIDTQQATANELKRQYSSPTAVHYSDLGARPGPWLWLSAILMLTAAGLIAWRWRLLR